MNARRKLKIDFFQQPRQGFALDRLTINSIAAYARKYCVKAVFIKIKTSRQFTSAALPCSRPRGLGRQENGDFKLAFQALRKQAELALGRRLRGGGDQAKSFFFMACC